MFVAALAGVGLLVYHYRGQPGSGQQKPLHFPTERVMRAVCATTSPRTDGINLSEWRHLRWRVQRRKAKWAWSLYVSRGGPSMTVEFRNDAYEGLILALHDGSRYNGQFKKRQDGNVADGRRQVKHLER